MTFDERIKAIKAILFNQDQPAPAPAPAEPAKFAEYTLKDGTVVSVSELAVGGTVMIGDTPAPAGTHELAEGGSIVVGEGGVITEVIAAPEDPAEPAEDFGQKFAAVEARFAEMGETISKQGEMLAAFDAALKQSGETMKQLLEVVEQLAKAPTADPAEPPKQNFKKAVAESKVEKFTALADSIKKIKGN